MGIITLTSDLGNQDNYVASVKAAILSQAPQATIVDISHEVRSFDINAAAFLLRGVWQQFPIGTVHVIGINPELKIDQPHVIVHYLGHYFVGADNGIFSLILDEIPEDVYEINLSQGADWTFPMRGVFATAAAHLSKGGSPEFLGRRSSGIREATIPTPSAESDLIRGHVIYIDHYGNVFTNITKSLFDTAHYGRNFAIVFKSSGFAIQKISHYYTEVVEGERLAMWSSGGHLMIAIHGGASDHGGGASDLFGLQIGDSIRIDFYGDKNREDDFQV